MICMAINSVSLQRKTKELGCPWYDRQAELIVFDLLWDLLLGFILFFSPFLLLMPRSFVKWLEPY